MTTLLDKNLATVPRLSKHKYMLPHASFWIRPVNKFELIHFLNLWLLLGGSIGGSIGGSTSIRGQVRGSIYEGFLTLRLRPLS